MRVKHDQRRALCAHAKAPNAARIQGGGGGGGYIVLIDIRVKRVGIWGIFRWTLGILVLDHG